MFARILFALCSLAIAFNHAGAKALDQCALMAAELPNDADTVPQSIDLVRPVFDAAYNAISIRDRPAIDRNLRELETALEMEMVTSCNRSPTCATNKIAEGIGRAVEKVSVKQWATVQGKKALEGVYSKTKGFRPYGFFIGALTVNLFALKPMDPGSMRDGVLLVAGAFVGQFMSAAFDPFFSRMRQIALGGAIHMGQSFIPTFIKRFGENWRKRQAAYTNIEWEGVNHENGYIMAVSGRLLLALTSESLVYQSRHIAIAARRARQAGAQFEPDNAILVEEFNSILAEKFANQETVDLVIAHLVKIDNEGAVTSFDGRKYYQTLIYNWLKSETFKPDVSALGPS